MSPQISLPAAGGADAVLIDHSTNAPGARIVAKMVGDSMELSALREGDGEDTGVPWVAIPTVAPIILFFFMLLAPFMSAFAQAPTTNYQFTAFPLGATSELWQGNADLVTVDYTAVNYDAGDSNLLDHVEGIDGALLAIAPISYTEPAAGEFVDDYIEFGTGVPGEPTANKSPIAQPLQWKGIFTIDAIIMPDLMGQDPNDNTVSCDIKIVRNYGWDPILGPYGDILYQWNEADMAGYRQGGSRYVLDPPWVTITDELFTLVITFDDQSAITGSGWESVYPLSVTSVATGSGTELIGTGDVIRYPSGVFNDTIHAGQRYAAIWHKQTADTTEIINSLLPSDSIEIDVTTGALSLERYQQPNFSTADMSANLIVVPGTIRTTGTGAKKGFNYMYDVNSDFTLLGFSVYTDTTDRGELLNYGIRTQDESFTFTSGTYDDTAGTGTGFITFMFTEGFEMQTGERYSLFVDYADGDGGGYTHKSAGTYSDAFVDWYGANYTETFLSPVGSEQSRMNLILGSGSDLAPWNILEEGPGISLTTAENVTTVSAGTGANGSPVALTWGTDNLGTLDVDVWGVYVSDVITADTLSTGVDIVMTDAQTHNRHIVIEVNSATDSVGDVLFTGFAVDEALGTVGADTETITMNGLTHYQSAKKWIGALTISTTEVDLTDVDIHTTSYCDRQNTDFHVSGARFTWTPSNPTWDIALEILHVLENGSYVNLTPLFVYDSTDTYIRADSGDQGGAKSTIDADVLGSANEGIILRITGATATPTAVLSVDAIIDIEQ